MTIIKRKEYTVDELVKAGGKVWEGRRVYFNDLLELADGIELEFYSTGNVSRALVDGQVVPNSRGKIIAGELSGKFWYDLEARQFDGRNMTTATHNRIVRGLKKRLDQ